ncbi:hypothetical protein GMST_39980 [Geomonas silvestris]|uniref:Uncharacterized protein n=1 Tax=Geomonas silvestris TaxID=2740184 RepID=A0A6V8MPN7_9BACT|nr:hypothetical protein [Geomonas silvestris]GFO61673.1 hypothetical protein GMST_39980 [Geomonas silvestris]
MNKDLLAIRKWAEGKPFLIALIAPQLAVSARDMHLAFRHIRERRIFDHQYPMPPLPAWFAMYRSHSKINRFTRALFSDFSKFGGEGVELGETILQEVRFFRRGKLKPSEFVPSPEDLKELLPHLQSTLSASFQEIEEDFFETPVDPQIKKAALQLFTDMEMESSFFIFVLIPCWLLYREHPTNVYRKARQGDLDALEKLLRLDPLMLHDQSIGKRIQALRFNNKAAAYQNLLEAPLKRPKARITRKKMKYAIAGLISGISSLIKKPLTEPEIRALFDAVANDSGASPIDTDLADSPEAFAKAINRDRAFWLHMFLPDKKK